MESTVFVWLRCRHISNQSQPAVSATDDTQVVNRHAHGVCNSQYVSASQNNPVHRDSSEYVILSDKLRSARLTADVLL